MEEDDRGGVRSLGRRDVQLTRVGAEGQAGRESCGRRGAAATCNGRSSLDEAACIERLRTLRNLAKSADAGNVLWPSGAASDEKAAAVRSRTGQNPSTR
jgi:hypothetical protein